MPAQKRSRNNHVKRDPGDPFSSDSDSESPAFEPPRPHKKPHYACDEEKENRMVRNGGSTEKPRIARFGISSDIVPSSPACLEGDEEERVFEESIRPFEYVLIPRPLWDLDGENWRHWSMGKATRMDTEQMQKKLNAENAIRNIGKVILNPTASGGKSEKWVTMRCAWKHFQASQERIKAESTQDVVEDSVLDFDTAWRSAGPHTLEKMWALLSGLGLLMNQEDVANLTKENDFNRASELADLIGCALLTTLSAIDNNDGLGPNSRYLDLALVIGYFLEIFHDLPALGVDGSCQRWSEEAISLFKQCDLNPRKGVFGTENHINGCTVVVKLATSHSEDVNEAKLEAGLLLKSLSTTDDPWDWSDAIKRYKNEYGERISLRKMNTPIKKEASKTPKTDIRSALGTISIESGKLNV